MLKKKLLFSALFALSLSVVSYAQLLAAYNSGDTNPTVQADQMPYFRGCTNLSDGSLEKRACSHQAMINYIAKNLEVPQSGVETGVVYVSFWVDEIGKLKDATILRGLSKDYDAAALKVVNHMPDWEPALLNGNSVKVKMTLPIRFTRKDESEYSNGFQLTWGDLKGKKTSRDKILDLLTLPITVRDESGNILEVNELLFERERDGKYQDAQGQTAYGAEMQKLVKKLKTGDLFSITATVQKKGRFYYVERSFMIEN
jgi:TonB family protein